MELRKNLLTSPRLRDGLSRAKAAKIGENATTMAPLDLPPPKQGCCSAGGGLVACAKALCQMSKCGSWEKMDKNGRVVFGLGWARREG